MQEAIIGYSHNIIQQLSLAQQLQFPVVLMYRYACDMRIIRMLRQRGLGNSTMQMSKKLTEQHSEVWLNKTAKYLTDAQGFIEANKSGL
jgi:endonuclease V-like protein UPF0215 family